MHIKDIIANEIYCDWDLDNKDESDVFDALAEAFMRGVVAGGKDPKLFEEAKKLKF